MPSSEFAKSSINEILVNSYFLNYCNKVCKRNKIAELRYGETCTHCSNTLKNTTYYLSIFCCRKKIVRHGFFEKNSFLATSQTANTAFNPPPGLVFYFGRILPEVEWNPLVNLKYTSPSMQCSVLFGFTSTLDPDQPTHHCLARRPDTTQKYPILPLKKAKIL